MKSKTSHEIQPKNERDGTDVIPSKSKSKAVADDGVSALEYGPPLYDPDRKFKGIEKIKIDKKDRHDKALHEFSEWLDRLAESLEQDLLDVSRKLREDLESSDIVLSKEYIDIEDDNFLLLLIDSEVLAKLVYLKKILKDRNEIIENFKQNLEAIEIKRTDIVGKELKILVDKLSSIGHKLKDDIEHIIETETHELNVVSTTNRTAHSQLVRMLQVTQAEKEIEVVQRWENGQKRWRVIHHERILSEFSSHIHSAEFREPKDRHEFMAQVRANQSQRHKKRLELLGRLAKLTTSNISKKAVESIQAEFALMSEDELNAIQECYNGITHLRSNLKSLAEQRVEALRHDMHHYAALKVEPELLKRSEDIQKTILDDGDLEELWRQAPGLKQELQQSVLDLSSSEIVYDPFLRSLHDRLSIMIASFPLKDVYTERGRAGQLEQLRNSVMKLRVSSRNEVMPVLEKLLPDLEEVSSVNKLPEAFTAAIQDIVVEMKREQLRIKNQEEESDAHHPDSLSRASSARSRASSKAARSTGTRKSGSSRVSKNRKNTTLLDKVLPDQVLLKAWSKRLSILFFTSELSSGAHKVALVTSLSELSEQSECNRVVDDVIHKSCDNQLRRLDTRYKKLIDSIASFLENQAGTMSTCTTVLCNFFLNLAKIVEEHRKAQHDIDETSLDQLWDFKEDFRFGREDREEKFQKLCDIVRQSVSYEDLQENFQNVLDLLGEIQDSYRSYHARACYLADKHPLLLAQEFKDFTWKFASSFNMHPSPGHPVDRTFSKLLEVTARKNKQFIREDFPEVIISESLEQTPEETAGAGNNSESLTAIAPSNQGKSTVDAENNVLLEVTSPLLSGDSAAPNREFGGKYTLDSPLGTFVETFFIEPASADDEDDRSTGGGSQSKLIVDHLADLDDKGSARSLVGPGLLPAFGRVSESLDEEQTYSEAPWLLKSVPWLTLDEIRSLEGLDKEEYDELLAKGFIGLAAGAAGASNNSQEGLEGSELYKLQAELVKDHNDRQAILTDPAHVLSNPPLSAEGKAYVAVLEITRERVTEILVGFRTDIIRTIEMEAGEKILQADALNKERKAELNDELDDRLRTHWPRRGRVETQIKQPREAELLGHEEKTWRHISNVHDRVKILKNKVDSELYETKRSFDEYIKDVTNLKNALNAPFKTLAALQGMDVKARGVTLQFQSKCHNHFAKLGKLAAEDTAAIKAFALDFRKICPAQVPGKEGGYSESELDEIERQVRGQCQEIDVIAQSWQAETKQLREEQAVSENSLAEFSAKYEAKALELSLAEGLGQKYGAPRRCAQARLRTEVSRDEAAAGRVDELVATLEFMCAEQQRDLEWSGQTDEENQKVVTAAKESGSETDKPEGRCELESAHEIWSILSRIRVALFGRASYLKVIVSSTPSTYLDIATVLPWVPLDSIPIRLSDCLPGTDKQIFLAASSEQSDHHKIPDSGQELSASPLSNTFVDVVEETESICRKETKELYLGEGRGDALNAEGVPDSLQSWLAESHEKMLGSGGYLEKASKRLWVQIERVEHILCRRVSEEHLSRPSEEDDDAEDDERAGEGTAPNPRLSKSAAIGAPGLCLRLLFVGHMKFVRQLKGIRESAFLKVVRVLEKCRLKHERNLRPKLGSPDAVDELNGLDAKELERSQEFVDNVLKFRNTLVRYVVDRVKCFVEDLVQCSASLMAFFDRCIHKECMSTPPGCAVPKKRMTAKRLRKAQKLKDAVSQGKEDTSKVRVWPALPLEQLQAVVESSEAMVLPETRPATPALEPEKPAIGKKPPLSKAKAAAVIELPLPRSTTLLSADWLQKMASTSSIRAEVSTAHRTLIEERNLVMDRYVADLSLMLDEIKDTYGELLLAEAGWSERWKRQVLMLRKGDM